MVKKQPKLNLAGKPSQIPYSYSIDDKWPSRVRTRTKKRITNKLDMVFSITKYSEQIKRKPITQALRSKSVSTQDIGSIQIGLTSPERILEWAERRLPKGELVGEVTKSETINYRTLKPEKDGLFCERIFGPVKDGQCSCGYIKQINPPQSSTRKRICPRCGVQITDANMRRKQMGYIRLTYPVVHLWYLRAVPSYLSILLDMSRRDLEGMVYCTDFTNTQRQEMNLCLHPDERWIEKRWEDIKFMLREVHDIRIPFETMMYGDLLVPENVYDLDDERLSTGTQAIYSLLKNLDLKSLAQEMHGEVQRAQEEFLEELELVGGDVEQLTVDGEKALERRNKLVRRLRTIEHFQMTGCKPEWMILTLIPVLPPQLRPIVQLDGGRFATSDLNDLYRCIIYRNNRFASTKQKIPGPLMRGEKRLLQEAVDSLLDNGRGGKPVLGTNNRPLKSLADILKGKEGRFRQNLLGKRVDYSGRSVIVVGPDLQLHQCGLPKEMAIELFQPFLIRALMSIVTRNIRAAKNLIYQACQRGPHSQAGYDPLVWRVLELLTNGYPILLNRAPTLHRLGIQAFEPKLIDGRAIQLHPLVCPAFNADFDGDQMAVHIPLSQQAKTEASLLMLSSYNLLSPATGQPVMVPSQDMVLGWYYLTTENLQTPKLSTQYFGSLERATLAYYQGSLEVHTRIWVQWNAWIELTDDPQMPLEIRIEPHGGQLVIYKGIQRRYNPLGECIAQYLETTPGRILFNRLVHKCSIQMSTQGG